jgi:epoxyqueuosine reductase
MSPSELTDRLKAEATRLGFDAVAVAPAVAPPGYPHFLDWLTKGHAAGMEYLERHAVARGHPAGVLENVRSIVVVSLVYGQKDSPATEPGPTQGKVARYARGGDYHRVLWDRLDSLLDWLRDQFPAVSGRAVADTAPFMERDFARMAGLGWIGKNTMLINRRLGSFTFLGALLVDAELVYDAPHEANHCGSCTRCLDACPTQAFAGPYELDSRRCISYWTIEHRGTLPAETSAELHGWVFGCDICQDVCPWNRKAPPARAHEFDARPEWTDPDLIEWLSRDPALWRSLLPRTALARAKRTGLLRNAALVLGARRLPAAVTALAARLDDSTEDPVVRASAAWALGQIGTASARSALDRNRDTAEALIRDAIGRALADGE